MIIILGVTACNAPGLDAITSYDEPPNLSTTTTSAGATSIEPAPTTSVGDPPASTTSDPGSTSASSGSSGPLDPLAPPTILDHTLGPDPLENAGIVATMIATAHADGVRMQVDDGAPIELTIADPDLFHGEFPIYTALDNGAHAATFTAWRDTLESAPLILPFTVDLPQAGGELFWDSDNAIGQGTIVALAVTPDNDLIELGTYHPMGQPRCYLRRRDLGGAWGPDDFLDLMPDTTCSATDLAVDADGALYILAERLFNGELRWWLGKIDAWAAPPVNIGTGTPGETANAIAIAPTRTAVCGTKPFGTDADATAWIFTLNNPGNVLSFDFVSAGKLPHSFRETPHDCVFSDARLVLAGGARGPHDIDNVARDRHFLLELDLPAGTPTWIVAGADSGIQSAAQTIALDLQGRYITGGHTCDDNCNAPVGELRMFLPGATQVWQRPLDPALAGPRHIAMGPAGYLVFVSAMTYAPNDTAFFAQAWFPLQAAPLWSYEHHDALELQSASTLAFGPYGQIYAGGVSAGGLPVLAIIAP